MDAQVGLNVSKFDIAGAYLHTDMDEYIITFLEVSLCDIIVKLETKIHLKYVTIIIKGRPLLYAQIKKDPHDSIWGAIIFTEIW